MASSRTNITLPKGLYEAALKRVEQLHYGSFSEYVSALVREDSLVNRPKTAVVSEDSTAYSEAPLTKAMQEQAARSREVIERSAESPSLKLVETAGEEGRTSSRKRKHAH